MAVGALSCSTVTDLNDEGASLQSRVDELLRSDIVLLFIQEVARAPVGSAHELLCDRPSALVRAIQRMNDTIRDTSDEVSNLAPKRQRLQEVGRDLLTEDVVAHWFAALARDRQVWGSKTGVAPDVHRFQPVHEGVPWAGRKPPGGIWTSTLTAAGDTSWMAYLRSRPGEALETFRWWRVEIDPHAKVFEVSSPRAWAWLCERFPAGRQTFAEPPKWDDVAQEWDAIHMTSGGLVATLAAHARGELQSPPPHGWDAESTLWLRWCITDCCDLAPAGPCV